MIGAVAGDIIGSAYEGSGEKSKDFVLFDRCRFTDDTVLVFAVAQKLLRGGNYAEIFQEFFDAYPMAGYGRSFSRWARSRSKSPYGSFGNGSAMRVVPIGYAFETIEETVWRAKESAEVTHNHPEGIRGAQAVAAAVFLARTGSGKDKIKRHIEAEYGYRLGDRLEDIRQDYRLDISCQGSVPQSIIAFLESADYEDAVRNAVSLGGDADTMACVAGGIAEAFYGGIPGNIASRAVGMLDDRLRGLLEEFLNKFALVFTQEICDE